MSTMLHQRPAASAGTPNGGVPARRAVFRWAIRLFRQEWRQQLLVLGMLAVAVAATIWGAGVATNTPPPPTATYGTANAMIALPGSDPHLSADIAAIQQKYGPIDLIEDQVVASGTTQNIELRAQDPAGRYGAPLLALDSGRYPSGPGQAALTSQVASLYGLKTGDTWHENGRAWLVTGIVSNPTDLLDEFALVAPGQVSSPDQATILLDQPASASQDGGPGGPGSPAGPRDPGQSVFPGLPASASVSLAAQTGGAQLSPATIVLVIAVLGLVFIGLVSVAGFTVIAQRRLRALGMISALGATERNVRLVMMANGAVVGVTAAVIGAVAGFGAWFAYVPGLQSATGHRINPLNLPWWAIVVGILLAVVTSVLAARRPARVAARIPAVAALSGRPAEPKGLHRSALPGMLLIGGGIVCLLFSGGWGGNSGSDSLFLLVGLVATIVGIFLFAPLCVTLLSVAAGARVPVSVRIALRDLVRYRARSGAALAATTFAVFLAMLICIIASVRLSGTLNALDYSGPNLTSSQLVVYTSEHGPDAGDSAALTQSQLNTLRHQVDSFAASVHAKSILPLETTGATLQQQGRQNNNFSGTLYVADPALLARYGINNVDPRADVLTMRPGLAGEPDMQLLYGDLGPQGNPSVLANPKIDTVSGLPSGTSAPNTVITMHAITALHLRVHVQGWLIDTPRPLTASQISAARQLANAAGVSMESKSGELALGQISDGATALGLIIALGVLAMTVGLVRGETARDLRTLTATGAAATTRRTITAATAGALALLGTVLGTAGAAIAGLAWAHSSLSDTFGGVPRLDYLLILVGLPAISVIGGWLLAGREPAAIARQPLE
ncbi:MAG: FtsX-like permease family protein [Streptosporangiaceae bacterium]|nr:FtsX-like permease family protein [Streptosporangiaceae bacterium]